MAGATGRSGRRPKPVALKSAAGNPGKRPLNYNAPAFTPLAGVAPPDWFIENDFQLAIVMWDLTTKELCAHDILCITDLAVLERWCVAYEVWRQALIGIKKNGTSMTGPTGALVKNPDITVKKEQEKEMDAAGSRLGLDPTSRQHLIGAAGKQKGGNPFLNL